ncbi:MAG: flippase [Parcubacteria group bacterium]|jgi:stage V sporulation protein B
MSSIAKSAIWVTISEIFFNLSGFIIHSILGRVLGPADYGRYGIIVTLTTMVIILIGNGIPTAMAKYLSEIFESNPRMIGQIKKQAIRIQLILISCITIIFFSSSALIAKALGDPSLTPLFQFSTLIIPAFAAASFYFSYFTGLHRFNTQATLKTVRSFLRITFVVGMAIIFGLKGSISGYIIAPFSVFLIAFLIDKFSVHKQIEKQIQASSYSEEEVNFDWKKLVNYGWQIIAFFLAYELLISIDLYLVKGILHDDALTGIYNASLTVGRIPYYIFYAMTVFLLPMVSKKSAANNNLKDAKEIINHAMRIMLIFLVPMVVLMSVYATEILQLLYGQRYLTGAEPMAVLVFGVGFLTIFYVLSFAANGAGKTITTMWIALGGLLLNTVLNYFFILRMGILGSAVATTIASFIVMAMILYYMKKHFNANMNLLEVLKVSLVGTLLYFLASSLPTGKYIFIPIALAVFALYLGLLYILKGITQDDLLYLRSAFKKEKKV